MRHRAPTCREGEIARRNEMRIQAACGRLEALYAGRMARMDKLASHFFRTATGPSLYWCPGKPCRELASLEEQQVGNNWRFWNSTLMDTCMGVAGCDVLVLRCG